MKMKNRKYLLFIIVIIITFVIMYPYQTVLNDGGSKQYKSLIYEITSYHSLDNHYISGYKNGISIKLFGFLIFEKIEKPNVESENERIIKINDQLYYEVKEEEETVSYCNEETYDGEINKHVENTRIPTNNNESNFNEDLKYIFVNKEVIKTCPNNSRTQYFKTKEKQTYNYMNIEDGNLDIHSDFVLELYQKVNPSEDATILKDFYQNPTFSNSYIITVGLSNLILEKEIKDTEEYINADEVQEEIQKIFGNVSFYHQDVFLHSKNIFGKGICGYEYQSNSSLYQLKHGCDGNANEFFRRALVGAEKKENYLYLTEKSIYYTNDWNETLSKRTIYNNVNKDKILDYIETSSNEQIKINLEDYINEASTYQYIFKRENNTWVFKGIRKI